MPADKAFLKPPPADIIAEIKGTGWDLLLDYFANPQIVLTYDLRKTAALNLNANQLKSAISKRLYTESISVEEVNYEALLVQLETKHQRKVPLKIPRKLRFAPGYQLQGRVGASPDSVWVTGPASAIDTLKSWSTDSLVLSNLSENLETQINLQTPPGAMTISPKSVKVYIGVEQFTEKSLFVPIQVRNAPDSFQIYPRRIRVTCLVGLSRYNDLKPEDFALTVDLDPKLTQGQKTTVPITLDHAPSFVRQVNFTPPSAEYFLVQKE